MHAPDPTLTQYRAAWLLVWCIVLASGLILLMGGCTVTTTEAKPAESLPPPPVEAVFDSGVPLPRPRIKQRPKRVTPLECALDGGQIAGWELTGAAGLSEDESHGQAPHP